FLFIVSHSMEFWTQNAGKFYPVLKILKNIRLKADRSPLLIIRLIRKNLPVWLNSSLTGFWFADNDPASFCDSHVQCLIFYNRRKPHAQGRYDNSWSRPGRPEWHGQHGRRYALSVTRHRHLNHKSYHWQS